MIPRETLYAVTDLIQTTVKKAKTYGALHEDGVIDELTCRVLALRIMEMLRPDEDIEGLDPAILEMMQNANSPRRDFPGGRLFGDKIQPDDR